MNKWRFAVAIMAICVVFEVVVVGYALVNMRNNVERFTIEEQHFKNAVAFAVTSYLDRVVSPVITQVVYNSASDVINFEKKFIVVNLGTWSRGCSIDGVCFSIGDYTPYGVLLRVGSGVAYCRDGEVISILRNGANSSADGGRPRQRATTPADDSAPLDNERIL